MNDTNNNPHTHSQADYHHMQQFFLPKYKTFDLQIELMVKHNLNTIHPLLISNYLRKIQAHKYAYKVKVLYIQDNLCIHPFE